MVRVLVAGILALLISIAIGPRFIRFLREREYGQQIREEGPSHHIAKMLYVAGWFEQHKAK